MDANEKWRREVLNALNAALSTAPNWNAKAVLREAIEALELVILDAPKV